MTEAERKAKAKYRKKLNHVEVTFFPAEKELYEQLQKQPNKAGYIKNLIRQDIKKGGL